MAQNYKENTKNTDFGKLNGYLLLKLNANQLKMMSDSDLSVDDYRYLEMFEKYVKMRNSGLKVTFILRSLADEYKISESSVKRIVKRLSQRVKL